MRQFGAERKCFSWKKNLVRKTGHLHFFTARHLSVSPSTLRMKNPSPRQSGHSVVGSLID
jgi:hypothetical protein